MDNFTTAFLPIRKGSQRVKDKNFRAFGINGESLYELKIAQLLASEQIDRVIVSTTDERVYDYEFTNEKLTVIERPEELGLSTTKTDDLVKYALDLVDSGWLLWTHVTSPFFTAVDYDTFILDSKKKIASGDYDSAVTVLQHKGYFFTSQNLALFDQSRVRWPATQTVEPIIEINNAGFLGHLDILRKTGDRLGNSPYFFPSSKTSSMDIDWEDDFLAARALHQVLK